MITYLIIGCIVLLVFIGCIWFFRFRVKPGNDLLTKEERAHQYAIEQAKKQFEYSGLGNIPKDKNLQEQVIIDDSLLQIPQANKIEFLKDQLEEINNQIKDLESQPKNSSSTIKKHALIEMRLEIETELYSSDNSSNKFKKY